MTRTPDDILAKVNELEQTDLFGFMRGDLIQYLSFDDAKPFLVDEATAGMWKQLPSDRDSIIAEITSYMPFAWSKANNCRGLSASRSLNHMAAWLWMLGEDAAAEALDEYSMYGKPHLRAICERFGINWQDLDDGFWRNSEDEDGMSPRDATRIHWT